jgi:hypothetical protein
MVFSGGFSRHMALDCVLEVSEETGVVILRAKVSSKDTSKHLASNPKHISLSTLAVTVREARIESRYSDWLRAVRFVVRAPVGGEIFRTHRDRLGGPPSFLHSGYRDSVPEVKRPGRGVDNTSPSSIDGYSRSSSRLCASSGI